MGRKDRVDRTGRGWPSEMTCWMRPWLSLPAPLPLSLMLLLLLILRYPLKLIPSYRIIRCHRTLVMSVVVQYAQ